MQVTELSTQVIRVLSSDGDCVRFRYDAQKMILTVNSMAGLVSLLLHIYFYSHRLQGHVSQAKGGYSWTYFHAIIIGIQHMLDRIQVPGVLILVVSQIIKMLMWVGFLRWKFRLVSTGLWSKRLLCMGCGCLLFDRGKFLDR